MTDEYKEDQNIFPKRLASGFWVLGNYYFNLYLIKGRSASALVEAGISATVDSVIEQLAVLAAQPDYLIVTHPHADHVTGLPGLRERFPKARVVATDGTEEFLNHPKAQKAQVFEDRFMHHSIQKRGVIPGRPPVGEPVDLGDYLLVGDGDTIDLGGVTLKMLSLKGHSPGNIGVRVPEIGALMVSDSLGFHYPQRGFMPLFLTGLQDWTATMDRLKTFPTQILCPAHQGPLMGSDVARAFGDAQKATRQVVRRITRNPKDEALAEAFFQEYYRDEFKLYSRENVQGCCDLLVRRVLEASSTFAVRSPL